MVAISSMDSDDTQDTVLFRRLYFLFPDSVYTRQAVNELTAMGVAVKDMHTVANKKVDISGLPEAKQMDRQDKKGFVEDMFWVVNLTVFFSALAIFLSDIFRGVTAETLVPVIVIAVCGFFGSKMSGFPNVQPEDFKFAIKRGEILLMVDMPEDYIPKVEKEIQATHPEVIIGGVGLAL